MFYSINMFSEQEIKLKIEEFLTTADIPAQVKVSPLNENAFSVFLSLDDEAGYFIGKGGENLDALEHVIRLIINKKAEQPTRIFVDINEYKERRAVILRERAKTVADRVKLSKISETFEPMSSFERRIIHLELAGRGDVITESIGEAPYRQGIIKPAN